MWRYLFSGMAIVVGATAVLLGSFDDPVEAARSAWNVVVTTDPIAQVDRETEAQRRLDALRAQTAQQQRELDEMQLQIAQMKLTAANLAQQEAERSHLTAPPATESMQHAMPPPPAPIPPPITAKPRAASPSPVSASPPPMSDREALLARLRKRFVNADDLPKTELPSPRQRLLEARAAAIEGRVTDAEKSLQEAHTQLAFQPVSPNQTTPSTTPTMAGRRIAQALTDLTNGDMQRAIRNIDLAMQSIN